MFRINLEIYQNTLFDLIDGINKNNLEKVKINHAKLPNIFIRPNRFIEETFDHDTDTMPLYIAAKNGNLDIVKYLVLEGQEDVNSKCWLTGQTALDVAIQNEHIELVEFLIENGADIDSSNYYDQNNTPLLKSIKENRNIEIINTLVRNGADLNIENKNGDIPLHIAVENGNIEIINILVRNGANLDMINYYENTALHIAVENGNIEIINFLIRNGADLNIENKNGNIPLHLAEKKGNQKMIIMLKMNMKNMRMIIRILQNDDRLYDDLIGIINNYI